MTSRARLTLVAALAVALSTSALGPLYSDPHWAGRALGAIAVVAAVGVLTRRGHVPAWAQPPLAAAALGDYVSMVFARSTLYLGLLPTRSTLSALHRLVDSGATDIQRLAPPVPSTPGLTLIAVLGVGGVAMAVDLVAVIAGRAAVAGLPLLVLFAVPSAVLPGGLGWLPFALGAVGWLSLLLVEGGDRLSRWGSPLQAARTERGYDDASLARVGRRIGAAALGVALIVPALLPGLDARLVGGGAGDGPGKGSHTTTTYNPITRLRADLRLPTPRNVLRYSTSSDHPDYLRLTTLDRFEDSGWSSSKLSGDPKRDGVKGTLPVPNGLSSAGTEQVRVRVRIQNLNAQWLPVPAVPQRVQVSGPWLYDERSETVFGIRTGTKKLKKAYTVTSIRAVPDRTLLAEGPDTGAPDDIASYAVYPDVTPAVRQLAERVIAGKVSPYARVAAIQTFFTDPRSGFRYSTSSTIPGIDNPSALEAFLVGRTGFCEQYASAMAAMIRIAGVPARVAIGFTAGTKQNDGTYEVTTRDAHAWPEAWFAGSGWVRFEPTPRSDGQAVVPGYAVPPTPGQTGPGGQPQAEPQVTAGPDATDPLSVTRGRLEQTQADSALGAADSSGRRHTLVLALVAVLLLVVAAFVPRLLHVVRRRARWRAGGGALVAWAQVVDDAADLGHVWRPADSPHTAARHLTARFAVGADATEALERVAVAAERTRYARDAGAPAPGLAEDVRVVRAGLRQAVSRPVRWRAWLLPTSTVRWASAAAGTFVADRLDRFDDAVTAVGRRLRPRRAV